MYINYTDSAKTYAVACTSKRVNGNPRHDYIYLGKVIDKERGIYQNAERGVFTFNPQTREFGAAPSDVVEQQQIASTPDHSYSLCFGGSYLVNEFLYKCGLMDVIDKIEYSNKDTLHTMVLYYILATMANSYADEWYRHDIVNLLYPRANLSSETISYFLQRLGSTEQDFLFREEYIDFVLKHYDKDKNILIDSTGLPNSEHLYLTRTNVHNGKVSVESRLFFVVQRKTGLPLYYSVMPGNVVDVSTLDFTLQNLEALGVNVDSCLIDAGFNSADNLDLFYTEDHQCRIDYITRVKSNDQELSAMIRDNLATIDEDKANFVNFHDRYLFIVRKEIRVGSHKDNPAWMYLGYDRDHASEELHSLHKRARKKKLTDEEIFATMKSEGLFGVISGRKYECEEILPAYYQRQSVEQIFDFAKNYTKMLPLATQNENALRGHLLLSYIACCTVKMIQLQLKADQMLMGSRLSCMSLQHCIVYKSRIVIEPADALANETYTSCGIKCPTSIPIVEGHLQYEHAGSLTLPPEKQHKIAEKKTQKDQSAEPKVPRKRGRPKGSKNRKTLEREAAMVAAGMVKPHRGPGRPKGSKNKKTLEREAATAQMHRGPGRPKGSKNRKTPEREAAAGVAQQRAGTDA